MTLNRPFRRFLAWAVELTADSEALQPPERVAAISEHAALLAPGEADALVCWLANRLAEDGVSTKIKVLLLARHLLSADAGEQVGGYDQYNVIQICLRGASETFKVGADAFSHNLKVCVPAPGCRFGP